jgi:3-hydroxypropionyl-CoA synthetase (ADP-forming)
MELKEKLPSYVIIKNPVDLTGSATDDDYEAAINIIINDPNVDIIMLWFVFQDTPVSKNIYSILGNINKACSKPIICGAIGGEYTYHIGKLIKNEGIPVYYSVNEWVAAAEAISK